MKGLYFNPQLASKASRDPAKLEYIHCEPCPSSSGHPEAKTLETCPK